MKRFLTLTCFTLLTIGGPVWAANAPWSPDDVARHAGKRAKVLVAGRIERAINFDYFILADDRGSLLLNAGGVRQRLAAGDRVVVWGRFLGRTGRFGSPLGELEALHIGAEGSEEAEKLRAGNAVPPPPTAAVETPPVPAAPPAVPPAGAVADRLRTLDDLKSKGLITDEEYRDQRRRILNDL